MPTRPTERQIAAFKRVYKHSKTELSIEGLCRKAATDTYEEGSAHSLSYGLKSPVDTIVGGGLFIGLVCAFVISSLPALMIFGVLLGAGVVASAIRKIHAQREDE